MRSFQKVIVVFGALLGASVIAQQQAVDPAYLRQYYQQLSSHGSAGNPEATPIYEQNEQQQQQYVNPGQQIRVKDNVQEQIRAQQQQRNSQAYVAPSVRDYLQQPQQQQQYQQPQQQVVYRQPQAAPVPRPRPIQYQSPAGKPKQDDEEYDDQNSSYQFGFDVKDDEFTNYQNRKEVRDGSVIKGSYSVVDSDGFIRTVKYTADPKEGFKAEVIREPTDIVVKIPTPAPQQLLRQPQGQSGLKQQEYTKAQQYQPQQFHQYQQ